MDQIMHSIGEEEVEINFTNTFSQDLETGNISLREWDVGFMPLTKADERQGCWILSIKFLQLINFPRITFPQLVSELKKYGEPTTIRQVLAIKNNSQTLKNWIENDSFLIKALPAAGAIFQNGSMVPSIAREKGPNFWELMPMTTIYPWIAAPDILYTVVTHEQLI